jgi:GTP-binding protein HflX
MAEITKHWIEQHPNILLVAIYAPYNRATDINSYFEEFVNLARSNGIAYNEIIQIKLRSIDSGTFLTRGHLESIKNICDEKNIDQVIISEPLSPQQERNISDFLRTQVFDRTQLILDIFEKGAHSAEGKLQVSIAHLEHKKSRLAGKGVHLAQQSGALGLRGGFGETAKEKERRHIETLILKLKKHLKELSKTRETQRKQRLKSSMPLLCLIGYTNTGKSTILNALTKSDVLAQNKLFATLDTTTRELFINAKKVGLISDTVGFIQLLPHHLIEAFKSTLAELQYANLLLHVVDSADPSWETHIAVVHQILDDLEVKTPMLYVFNKIDKISLTNSLRTAIAKYQPNVMVSALSKEGLQPLTEYIEAFLAKKE